MHLYHSAKLRRGRVSQVCVTKRTFAEIFRAGQAPLCTSPDYLFLSGATYLMTHYQTQFCLLWVLIAVLITVNLH